MKCPRCGADTERKTAAISRLDNKTLICPRCGIREALDAKGIQGEGQEHILDLVAEYEADAEMRRRRCDE